MFLVVDACTDHRSIAVTRDVVKLRRTSANWHWSYLKRSDTVGEFLRPLSKSGWTIRSEREAQGREWLGFDFANSITPFFRREILVDW